MSRLPSISTLLVVFLLALSATSLWAVDPAKSLSPQYRHWVNEEVPYIISSDEKKEFLSLKSDGERENFIQSFWKSRNPNPGSDINVYKEEHYRRLAYANEHFGAVAAQNGWRTDQGRIYITLGEPQQQANYPNARNLRPLLIWFYQSPSPALPSHFYVVFYKRSAGEEYTLYSPYQDGPSRLTTGIEDMNLQERSLQTIRNSLGNEVARTAISLIPSEPVDLNHYSPTMDSDVMLSTIKGLADNPLTKEMITERRVNELVTSRILMGPDQAELQIVTFRDALGGLTASYLLVPHRPTSEFIGTLPDNQQGYALTLETTVATQTGQRVYKIQNELRGTISKEKIAELMTKRFAVEERLPLTPGPYNVEVTLTNTLTHIALRESKNFVVPDLSVNAWNMSNLVAFSQHVEEKAKTKLPFTIAGVRFIPQGVGDVSLHAGEPLWLSYQLWTAPGKGASTTEATAGAHRVKITYSYGRLQSIETPTSESEAVNVDNVDAAGNLLTGHMIPTIGMEPGTYRLVTTAIDEVTQQKAYATLSFRIVPSTEATDLWSAYNSEAATTRSDAIDDYKRGVSAVAQGQTESAILWFRRSLADDTLYLPALDRLVDAYSRDHRFAEIAALSENPLITRDLNEHTAILMAEADGQVGNPTMGRRILENVLKVNPPSQGLYLALAKLYQASGDGNRAEEFKKRAAELKN